MVSEVRGIFKRFGRMAELARYSIVLAAVLAVWGPFFQSERVNNAALDWTFRSDYTAYTLHAITTDHEFPFWVTSPRFEQLRVKGIHDFFANPETDVLSLVTALAPLGYLRAAKATLLVSLAIGVYGCRRLLRVFSGDRPPSVVATLVLALVALCNGAFCAHVIVGHVQFVTVATFPLALALYLEALSHTDTPWGARVSRASSAGAILAVSYYSGNTHPLIQFFILFVGVFTLVTMAARPRDATLVLVTAAALCCAFIALAAFKLFPSVYDFRGYRRHYFIGFLRWWEVGGALVTPWCRMNDELYGNNWPERYVYIGWAGVALCAFALTSWRRPALPFLAVVAVVAWLVGVQPNNPILTLPILRTQAVVTRFALIGFLALATASAVRIDELMARLARSRSAFVRVAPAALLACACAALACDLRDANVVGEIARSCADLVPIPQGPFDVGLVLAPEDPDRATLTPGPVTANAFRYEFGQRTREDPFVIVSDLPLKPRPHLRLQGQGELTESGGHLAVRVRGSRGAFALVFFDPLVWCGLLCSLVAWGALLWRSLPRALRDRLGRIPHGVAQGALP